MNQTATHSATGVAYIACQLDTPGYAETLLHSIYLCFLQLWYVRVQGGIGGSQVNHCLLVHEVKNFKIALANYKARKKNCQTHKKTITHQAEQNEHPSFLNKSENVGKRAQRQLKGNTIKRE